MTPNPEQMQGQQPGWFKRNWYWVLGGGCLSLMLCCGGFTAITYFGATSLVKNSVPFAMALKEATTNSEVKAALGEPIEMGMMRNSSYEESGGKGSLDFELPVSGPKGKGTLYGHSSKTSGSWEFDRLELVLESGKKIDARTGSLGGPSKGLPPGAPPEPPPATDPTEDVQKDAVNPEPGDKPLDEKQP